MGSSMQITQKWIHDHDTIKSQKSVSGQSLTMVEKAKAWCTSEGTLEGWVGRALEDSTELKRKAVSSHVARMTSGTPPSSPHPPLVSNISHRDTLAGNSWQAPKPVEIVRQSMPYGSVGGESGLFFIAFAAKPDNFEVWLPQPLHLTTTHTIRRLTFQYMLKRMVGEESDGLSDDVMKLSKCVQGTYWYFPSQDELAKL